MQAVSALTPLLLDQHPAMSRAHRAPSGFAGSETSAATFRIPSGFCAEILGISAGNESRQETGVSHEARHCYGAGQLAGKFITSLE